jgi:hypothetical protein
MDERTEIEANLDFEGHFLDALKRIGVKPSPKARPSYDESDEYTETIDTTLPDEKKVAEVLPTPINLFQHPDAHPVVLDLALLRKYGPEWMTWEAETLVWRIPQDFRTATVSDLNLSKIMAVKTMHFVDTFWKKWEVFVWCAMPLNNLFPDFNHMQVPTAAQCTVAVDIANNIRTDVEWSDELKAYLVTVFQHDDIYYPVDPIDFLTVPSLGVPVDTAEIATKWSKVRAAKSAPSGRTVVDEQLRRCLTIKNYVDEARGRLHSQLRFMPNV